MKSLLALLLAAAVGAACAATVTGPPPADPLQGLAPYQPKQVVEGTIRIGGNPYIPELINAWQQGFQRAQPKVRFETRLNGTEAAMANLYADTADVTFIGREPYQPEIDAFRQWFGYEPLGLKITSGSYATQHKTFSLMVYVHKDNPLRSLTMAQLDAIYGMERRRGAPAAIRTWGQLGLTGEWANRPIHVVGYNFDTGMAGYFRLAVLRGSSRWNPDMAVLDNGRRADGEVINAGVYILDKVAKDPYAIGFANLLFENEQVKSLSLADDNGPPVPPTREAAWRRDYPLTRFSTVFVNRAPGQPVDPKVAEFLRYILSRDGVAAVVNDGSFLPLHPKVVSEELKKIE